MTADGVSAIHHGDPYGPGPGGAPTPPCALRHLSPGGHPPFSVVHVLLLLSMGVDGVDLLT